MGDEGIVLAENNGMLPLSGTDKINVFGWAATNPIYGGTGSGSSSNEGYNYYAASFTNNSESYDDFAPEESYLQLSQSERDMVDLVATNFDKVVVVVNANNAMELGFVNDYDSIGAVLLAPGTGRTAMNALGKILKGTVSPSGRTVETYVYDQKATPAYNNYGSFTYDNVDDLLEQYTAFDPGFQGALSFVNYVEGIYVGYRFYKTAYAEAQAGNMTFDYNSVVQYPFGHGLSYTTFTQEIQNFSDSGNNITFDVVVTNTGSVAGKDVVEVYFTPPYNNGGIEKAAVNLIDFAKTDVLEPGASQTVSFTIPKEEMASYDSSAIKTANGGYILEAGEYTISLRADAHTELDSASFTVDTDIDYSVNGRESDNDVASNRFQDYSAGDVTFLSRADGFANYGTATAAPTDFAMPDDVRAYLDAHSTAHYNPADHDVAGDVMPTTGAKNGLKLADMMGKPYDDPDWEKLLDQLTPEEMSQLVQIGGFSTVALKSVDKKATMDSDGTGGLNDWYAGVYGTPYPTEVLIAQTWNKDLAYEVGGAIGQEYADCHIYGWYGPAMNIHRTAFNGRNFEYYSEDGVLAGYFASAEVNAAGEKGVYAYIKHFVANDQEINRCTAQQIYLTEQTLREIYMKPFEICVKNYDYDNNPLAVMSSFTLIGPKWTGANSELLNGVLRGEWGFQGMVLTDWFGSYGYQVTMDSVLNGNDMMLGFGSNVRTDQGSASGV